MGKEEKINFSYVIEITKELTDLHYKTGEAADFDDELLKEISNFSSESNLDNLTFLRIEMWRIYTGFLIEELDDKIKYLLGNFAQIDKDYITFKDITHKFENFSKEHKENLLNLKEKLEHIKRIFNETYSLRIKLKDNEAILLQKGKKFIITPFLMASAIVSSAYWVILIFLFPKIFTLFEEQNINSLFAIPSAVILWIVILGIIFIIIKNFFSIKNKEESQEE